MREEAADPLLASLADGRTDAFDALAASALSTLRPARLEQLVPKYLAAMPVDPLDGRPLRIKRLPDEVVIYAARDSAEVDKPTGNYRGYFRAAPIFRLKLVEAGKAKLEGY